MLKFENKQKYITNYISNKNSYIYTIYIRLFDKSVIVIEDYCLYWYVHVVLTRDWLI